LDTRPKMFVHSSYAMLVSRFLVLFDTRRIHFGVFAELVESPQHFIDRVLSWLEVEPMHLDESLLAARLPASKARSRHLAGAVKRGANWARTRGSTTLIGHVKRSKVVQQALYAPLKQRPEPSEEDVAYMRERLLPDVVRLEEIVGLDLLKRWKWRS